MAASKWLDPWAIAKWTDTTESPLLSHVWDALKEAADERKAIEEFDHSTGFTGYIFPDFNTDKSLAYSESPVNNFDNEVLRIVNASYPLAAVETDDIQTSGVVVSTSPANLYNNIAEILTDEFSYASGTPLIVTDTDSGSQNAVCLWSWMIQCYQMLNYPVYYLRRLKNNATGNAFYSAMELQWVQVDTTYNYQTTPPATTPTFTAASCFVTKRTSGAVPVPVDVYVANDLKEAAPMSTPQQVRDYTITTWGNNNSTWWSSTGHDLGDKENAVDFYESNVKNHFNSPNQNWVIVCTIDVFRIRFKTNDDYRSTSPTRYDTDKYWNGYYSGVGKFCAQIPMGSPAGTPPVPSTYSDFGTGKTNNAVEMTKMVEDGGGYYNIEIPSPDFDVEPVMGFPPDPGFNKGTSSWVQEFYLQALQLEAGTTLSAPFKVVANVCGQARTKIAQTDTSIYVKPNLTDGTGFEYYTP